MNFIIIAVVFMLAYGITRDVILNPETDRSLSTFLERLLVPYFGMYGELFIEYPQQNGELSEFVMFQIFDPFFSCKVSIKKFLRPL